MALDAQKIHVAAARLYLGGTAPASGTPPTWMTHAAGVPNTGGTWVDVGHTEGDSTFIYEPTVEDLKSNESFGIIDSYPTEQTVRFEFTAQERVYTVLKLAFDAIGTVSDGTRDGFYGGGAYAISSQTFFFSSKRRDAPTKYEIGVIYKAQSIAGIKLPYSRTTPSRYSIVIRGVHDTTRSDGDQLFQFSREK